MIGLLRALASVAPLAAAAVLAMAEPAAGAPPPKPRAAAAILVDARDGHVLLEKEADRRRSIASATKLMTALLSLERTRPHQVFAAPAYPAMPVESKIDLRRGERMAAGDLLRALLLESANDAAVTLARAIAGSERSFVSLMNRRAAEIGLADTHYANPIGFDHPENYSTARELARLALHLQRHERFRRIVDMPAAVLPSGARRRVVKNRNVLVRRHRFVDGIKTGYTSRAGHVLVGSASRAGARVISVVLGEPSEAARDSDTVRLLRWGLGRFRTVTALEPRRLLARVALAGRGGRVALLAADGVRLTLRSGQRVERRIRAPRELEGPLPAGHRVGVVTVLLDGRPVRRVGVLTGSRVPAPPERDGGIPSSLWIPLTSVAALGILGGVALLLRFRRAGRDRHSASPR